MGGKTLPLCRGEGVDQPQLLQLARKGVGTLCNGGGTRDDSCSGYGCQTTGSTKRSAGWINIHSEAGIFQNEHALGGRHNGREAEIGRLKWGAAKMIVHNPSYRNVSTGDNDGEDRGPVVIPFYVSGMDTVTPLNEHKRLIQPIPVPGHTVKVRFGPELRFDDLIEEYERNEGKKLRHYHCCSDPYCQEALRIREKGEEGSLNVRLSSALSRSFEKVSTALQSGFWRVLEGTGMSAPARPSDEATGQHPPCPESSAPSRPCEVPEGLMYNQETWVSTPQEKELYHLVMVRIEEAMQKLCDENKWEEEEKLDKLRMQSSEEED